MNGGEFQGLSAATTYEVNVLEKSLDDLRQFSGQKPTEELLRLSFSTMDKLIPCLGMYERVFSTLRNDLYKGVYSDILTTLTQKERKNPIPLDRVPYFLIVERMEQYRKEEKDDYTTKIRDLEASLKTTREKCLLLEHEVKLLEDNNAAKDLAIVEGNYQVDAKVKEINGINQQFNMLVKKFERAQSASLEEKRSLSQEIAMLEEEKRNVSVYKSQWDHMERAFLEKRLMKDKTIEGKGEDCRIQYSNDFTRSVKAIDDLQKLECQLLEIKSAVIKKYDAFVEQGIHKSFTSLTDVRYSIADGENASEREQVRLKMMQEQFVFDIQNIEKEMFQLKDQKDRLMASLKEMGRVRRESKAIKTDSNSPGSSLTGRTSSAGSDIRTLFDGSGGDPFEAHENILNRYSFVLYTSCNKGKTFYEMHGVDFCPSCGVKAVVCPHKVPRGSKVFELPANCTHVKLVCPEIPLQMTQSSLFASVSEDAPEIKRGEHFLELWEDYEKRCGTHPENPILFTENELDSFVRQFVGFLLWHDDYSLEEASNPILDLFYLFLESRYLVVSVINFVAFNFLISLDQVEKKSRFVKLFGLCLCKKMDMACLRYALLLGDYIEMSDLQNVESVILFFQVLYPSLSNEEIEYLKMEYISFSENTLSKKLVFQFVLSLILSNKEPWMSKIQSTLNRWAVRFQNRFSEVEFSEVMDYLSPLASEPLRELLIHQSQFVDVDEEAHITLHCAVHIAGYLSALQLAPKVREDIRNLPPCVPGQTKEKVHASENLKELPGLINYATLKTLGTHLTRRIRLRRILHS